MRLARYSPMVVVGLVSLAGQLATPQTSRAWDTPPEYAVPETESQPQNGGRMVDEAVQQAGYYDSRQRPHPIAPQLSSAESPSDHRNGPLFRGQALKMPKLPFGRPQPNNKAAVRAPQSSPQKSAQQRPMPSGVVNNQYRGTGPTKSPAQQTQQRTQTGSTLVARQIPQRMPAGASAVANSNFRNTGVAANQPPVPIRQDDVPHPAAHLAAPVAASPAPNAKLPVAALTKPATAPTTAPAPAAAAAKPAGPPSQADLLVAQAHEWSTHASTDQDYTRIIETCRRAQASQAGPATSQYAKNLISWSLNRRGQLKAEANQNKEAMLDFNDAIRADASCWRAVHNRGVLMAQDGKFEKAFDDFARTIQLNPQFAKAYSNRAALFMVANNLDAALQDYKKAIELDANLAVAHRGCGRVCQLLGQMDEAVGHYDAAVQLAPTDAYAAACRADLLTDLGRYTEALAEYDRAMAIDPKSAQAHCGSAWLLATCPYDTIRNPKLAVDRANAAIALGGDKDAVNYDTLAAAQANAGEFSIAIETIQTAIELAPADERGAYHERMTMYQQGQPYRVAPVDRDVQQASYQAGSGGPGAGS